MLLWVVATEAARCRPEVTFWRGVKVTRWQREAQADAFF